MKPNQSKFEPNLTVKPVTLISRFGDLLHLRPLDMIYIFIVVLSILAANVVSSAKHTASEVQTCMLATPRSIGDVPTCALNLVAEHGSSFSVLLGVSTVARNKRRQNDLYLSNWCSLQTRALSAYVDRGFFTKILESIWLRDEDEKPLAQAPAVCT